MKKNGLDNSFSMVRPPPHIVAVLGLFQIVSILTQPELIDAVGYGGPPNQQFAYQGQPVTSPGIGEYRVDQGKLYQKTGLVKESAGRSCAELLSMGMTDSGVYWLQPDAYKEPFQAHCDMKSFGGGWQMCYTSKYSRVHLTDEDYLAYNASLPYRADGYTSNCKYVPFNQIVYIFHAEPQCSDVFSKKCKTSDWSADDDQKAYFTYETTTGESLVYFTIAGNSGRNLITPAVQLKYSALMDLKRKYFVPTRQTLAESADQMMPELATVRSEFAGGVVAPSEERGLFENYASKLNIKQRTTDFWRGRGVAYKVSDTGVVSTTDNWKYEHVVCDEKSSAPMGLFMSGLDGDNGVCFKTCSEWCGDHTTDHYRASLGDSVCNTTNGDSGLCLGFQPNVYGDMGPTKPVGSAFKENGLRHTTYKLVSVGLRYRVQIPRARNEGDSDLDYQEQLLNWPYPPTNLRGWTSLSL